MRGALAASFATHSAWHGPRLVGTARVLSDGVLYAFMVDVIVDPAYRGRGVGAVLLRCCLRDLKQSGLATATIPWAAHLGFYEQHAGARRSRQFQRFRKRIHPYS